MRNVKAIVRTECLPRLIRALKETEAARLYVTRVHALGAGVDPGDFRVSMDEGEAHTEKTSVEFLCPAERVDDLVEVVRACAQTGHRGDGVIIVSEVAEVVSVRTGERDRVALL